jgi:hypothetical protein
MPERRDNSLLFSLKAIEELEESRIEAERVAKQRARSAEERQRARMERLAREAEMRRVEEEEKRRLEAERVRREEEARLEAEKLAAIERVRAEVDSRARSELERARAAQELELAKVQATAARGRYRFLLGLSAAALLAVGAIAAVLSRSLGERKEEAIRTASALESARKEREDAQAALNGARREIGDLRERLRIRNASTEASVEPKDPSTKGPVQKVRPKGRPKGEEPAPAASCDEWDPMGGCLPPRKK